MSGLLQACEAPPGAGQVTVAEVECRFLARDADEEPNIAAVSLSVPDMYVDAVSPLDNQPQDSTHHFLPVTEHWLKRALNTWRDEGVLPALQAVASNPDLGDSCVKVVSSWILALGQWAESLIALRSGAKMAVSELVSEFSAVSDWDGSPVRALDLHPRLPYIAIARQDDTVEIRGMREMESSIVLRDNDQMMVTCLQWAPHSSSLLAVGAKVGVLLWNVDPSLSTSRFLTSWVRVEMSPGHIPVTTISWSPQGNYLVSGSAADTSLVVWDIPMGVATRVRRTEGGGVSLVGVSPGGGRVFAASVGGVMRVWETGTWTCEKWSSPAHSARCQAACWSPAGDFLLFCLHGDHSLYYLCFHGNNTSGSVSAVKCADLSPTLLHASGQEETVVGGSVQSMTWDPTGQRIAIIFTADSPGHSLVAVLRTRLASSMLEILPGGFVRGEADDVPQLIKFQQNCRHGVLLATAWLSGRVSFTPLLCTHHPSPSPPSFHPPLLHPSHLYSTYTDHTHP